MDSRQANRPVLHLITAEGARLRSKVILQAGRPRCPNMLHQLHFLQRGDDDDEDDEDENGNGGSDKNSLLGEKDDSAAAGGIADALMYNEAVELTLTIATISSDRGDSLFDRTTIPRHLTRGSAEERRMRDQILAMQVC